MPRLILVLIITLFMTAIAVPAFAMSPDNDVGITAVAAQFDIDQTEIALQKGLSLSMPAIVEAMVQTYIFMVAEQLRSSRSASVSYFSPDSSGTLFMTLNTFKIFALAHIDPGRQLLG